MEPGIILVIFLYRVFDDIQGFFFIFFVDQNRIRMPIVDHRDKKNICIIFCFFGENILAILCSLFVVFCSYFVQELVAGLFFSRPIGRKYFLFIYFFDRFNQTFVIFHYVSPFTI